MNEYFDKVKNYLLTMDGDRFVDIWDKYRTEEMYKIYPSFLLDDIRDENDFYTNDLFEIFYKSCVENKFFNMNDDYFVFDKEDFVLYSAKKAVNLITSKQLIEMVNYILDESEYFDDEYLLEMVNENYDKKQEENRMMIKEMDYINKVVSKLYAVVNGCNVIVAEVIENCGCGFDYLIRICPEYQTALPIFAKCMEMCKVQEDIDYKYVKDSIEKGYLKSHEEIALIIDEVI
jgi:hypothetical protein